MKIQVLADADSVAKAAPQFIAAEARAAVAARGRFVLFVVPVLVLASFFMAPQPLQLSFSRPETRSLFIGVTVATSFAATDAPTGIKAFS
jgi:Ca2+/H+ antiporter